MRYVYQIHIDGLSALFDGKVSTYSTTVFSSRELAEKRVEKMKALCFSAGLNQMREILTVTIIPLEIVE